MLVEISRGRREEEGRSINFGTCLKPLIPSPFHEEGKRLKERCTFPTQKNQNYNFLNFASYAHNSRVRKLISLLSRCSFFAFFGISLFFRKLFFSLSQGRDDTGSGSKVFFNVLFFLLHLPFFRSTEDPASTLMVFFLTHFGRKRKNRRK